MKREYDLHIAPEIEIQRFISNFTGGKDRPNFSIYVWPYDHKLGPYTCGETYTAYAYPAGGRCTVEALQEGSGFKLISWCDGSTRYYGSGERVKLDNKTYVGE